MRKLKEFFTGSPKQAHFDKLVQAKFDKDSIAKPSYFTLLKTDKPIYKPGECVYIRGVILHSYTLKPSAIQPKATFKLFSPNGDNILTVSVTATNSVIAAYHKIPDDLAGGDYKIQITYPYHEGYTGAEREFNIRAFRAPRLKTQLKFLQKGYGAGEKATALLEVTRAEGGVPTNAIITAIATVDGNECHRAQVALDLAGNCIINFDLPKTITTGDGTLVCKIQDGGVIETASKTIPILLSTMDVTIYPEGGDLIAGVPCRFYVEAFTKTRDPADITAEIRKVGGKESLGEVVTEHEGRGRGIFKPESGQKYELHIIKPTGILNKIPFPAVKTSGISLTSTKNVFKGEPVVVKVVSPVKTTATIVLSRKVLEITKVVVELEPNVEKNVTLETNGAQGVLIVTVKAGNSPVAERLVFSRPVETIQVEIQPEKTTYTPGDSVKLKIKTSNQKGAPISASVGIQVTDDTVLEMVEKRQQAARLPAMALLEVEVDHLEDSEVLLGDDNNVDLLLGTQGWRRFVWADQTKFLKEKEIKAERVLGIHKADTPRHEIFLERGMILEDRAFPAMAMMEAAPRDEIMFAAPEMKEEEMKKEEEDMPVVMLKEMAAPHQAQKIMLDVMADRMMMEEEFAPMKKRMARDMDIMPVDDSPPELSPVIREYAHKIKPFRKVGDRTDFAETLYWNANVVTDAKGEATVEFSLCDSITSFRAFADSFADGSLGSGTALIESKNPFYMEPKLPLEVTYGDMIHLPVALVNETQNDMAGNMDVIIHGTGLQVEISDLQFKLKPNERARKIVPIQVGNVAETAKIAISATSNNLSDSVTRPLTIVPTGFPFQFGAGGLLEKNSTVTKKFSIPESVLPNSFETNVKVFTTPASTLTESLKSFIREPCGCFEQTSMTSYPLTMVLRYFTTHTGVDPKLIEDANEKLASGYKRLTGYECKGGGYEWFGSTPAHEALTAYGVMQFTEMTKVFPVDQAMLKRTTDWLLSRRDGKGGFLRSSTALDDFGGAPEDTTNAYIVWALYEAGVKVEAELEQIIKVVKENQFKDSYLVALLACTLFAAGRTADAKIYCEHLAKNQNKDGLVTDAVETITKSYGTGKEIETTSVATIAWLRSGKFVEEIEKSVNFLNSKCKNGSFGNTQSTVLALKALVFYDEMRSSPPAEGSVIVRINGTEVTSLGFDKTTVGTLECPSFASSLAPGDHTLEIEMLDGGRMPFTLTIDYFANQGATSPDCKLNLFTELSKKSVSEGETCQSKIVVENKTSDVLPMCIAIISIPGGLEVRHEQLKELVKSEKVAFYETKGRSVIFYWRYFAKKEKKELNIDLVAAVPGVYTSAASRAYLYYTNEDKVWNDGTKIEVTNK